MGTRGGFHAAISTNQSPPFPKSPRIPDRCYRNELHIHCNMFPANGESYMFPRDIRRFFGHLGLRGLNPARVRVSARKVKTHVVFPALVVKKHLSRWRGHFSDTNAVDGYTSLLSSCCSANGLQDLNRYHIFWKWQLEWTILKFSSR